MTMREQTVLQTRRLGEIILSALFLLLFATLLLSTGASGQTTPTNSNNSTTPTNSTASTQTPPAPATAAAPVRHDRVRRPLPRRRAETVTLVGAGDIAGCKNIEGAMATAKLLEQIPGTVFAAGDVVYERGSQEEFDDCYQPTWGRFKDRTRPAIGNHEYGTAKAAPYAAYFGAQAGPAGKFYYSYDLGAWHIVVLNTNCKQPGVGGCEEGSPQEVWLKEDLAQHAGKCVLAYGHHALFSSGIFKSHAVHAEVKPLWDDLYAAHADVMLAGHEHSYERFALQNTEGQPDPKNGIRLIVAGTGGRSHDPLGFAAPNSEVRNSDTYGVLKLELSPSGYTWEFVPEAGGTFRDSGSGACHNFQNAAAPQATKPD